MRTITNGQAQDKSTCLAQVAWTCKLNVHYIRVYLHVHDLLFTSIIEDNTIQVPVKMKQNEHVKHVHKTLTLFSLHTK